LSVQPEFQSWEIVKQAAVFRSLAENALDGIVISDPQGRVIYANRAAHELYGYDARTLEMIGISSRDTWPEDLLPQVAELVGGDDWVQRGGWSADFRQKRKDGSEFEAHISSFSVLDEAGTLIGLAASVRDITEQKRAQTALRRSQQMLQQVINTIPVRVFWKDRNLVYLGCNRLFAGDAGLTSPDQIIGKDDYAMIWRDQAELYRADDASVIESGTPKINEEPQTTPDGSTIWLRTSKIPILDADGSVIGVLGTYDDITERKQAEETIRQQQRLLRTVLDLIPAYVGMKDWNGRFYLANKQLAAVYGTTVEELVGKTDADFNPDADQVAAFLEADRQVMTSGQPLFIPEEPVTGPSGETRWFQTTKIPYVSEDGEQKLLFTAIDITERKQTEEDRQRLQQQVIEAQRQAIQELSTPIIPIMDRIIVMPLIGSIDTLRARDITRALLRGISKYRAKVVIVDITGVPLVDTGVANHLDKTIQAARLKGARTIITGVSDAVAETIVDLGIDWSGVETLRDLQSGLLAALNSLGIKVSR